MLTVPFTFPNTSSLRSRQPSDHSEWGNVIEHSFLAAKTTILEYWEDSEETDESGIIVGCEDGSLYVFSHVATPVMQPEPTEPRRKRPRSPLPITSTRGVTSPISPASASFALSFSRPRTVSGVTKERVEAPKNYVDFEDEPDKLKGILQGRNPKEKQIPLDFHPSPSVSPAPSIMESLSTKRKSPPRALLSVGSSTAPTPRSFSSPGSPQDQSSSWLPSFSLRYHIIPECAGPGHAVRDIQVLGGNKYIAVLHQPGDISIYSIKGGECVASASVSENGLGSTSCEISCEIWNWCSLKVGIADEDTLLFATGATDSSISAATPDLEESSSEKSQTVVFLFCDAPEHVQLERLGHCQLNGPAKGIGIHRTSEGSLSVFSIDAQGHLMFRHLLISEPTSQPSSMSSNSLELDHINHLALPKSIKALVTRSSDNLDVPVNPEPIYSGMSLQEPYDAGLLLSDSTLSGLATRNANGILYGIVWAHRELTVFSYHVNSLRVLFQASISDLEDAEWLDDESYALSFNDRLEVYKLRFVDDDNDVITPAPAHDQGATGVGRQYADLVRILPTGPHEAGAFIPSSDLVVVKVDKGRRKLLSFHVRPGKDGPHQVSTVLWQAPAQDGPLKADTIQTATLPVELEIILQGYSDGRLRQFSLEQMILSNQEGLTPLSALKTSQPKLSGSLMGLNIVQNPRTREKYIVGGVDDGSIAFWNMSTFELCARWTAFCAPLIRVLDFENDSASALSGCILCIAADGTIAVVVVDGFQFLYLIPGSQIHLNRLCVSGNRLLLFYGKQLARLWDIQAKEFRRSMSSDKAVEMLKHDDWVTAFLEPDAMPTRLEWRPIAPAFTGRDAVATLAFSLEKFVVEAITLTKTISTSKDEVRNILRTFDRLRLLLSVVLTPDLSPDVDSICTGKLGLPSASVGVGLSSPGTTTIYPCTQPRSAWCISANASASRMLSIVFVLRALSLFEDSAEAASAVTSFYTTSLGPCIGPKYIPPSLEYLGRMWFVASNELRHSIRVVFDATLAQLSDQEVIAIAEKWQQYVPASQPESERENIRTALALCICGFIAAARFCLLSVDALVDISQSVAIYFHDENSTHRVLAIDLCSKGFHVWQQYVDTLQILRSLFMLATTTRKASISVQNVGAQARLAVLSIAAQNTALFMSTLCLDVLDPSSLEHRRSVMQILAFLIRKRPLILQPALPRLMEAVVKSLDPNSNANREAVFGAATEIIGYVVKTYPTVDFHGGTQRLAVGTSEGAVVMYDLKTAIRLYVLEGHRHPLTACKFSPDGRRLVTISLVDRHVLVWKVGTGFTSFFTPGLPPRQGHGGSEPFKTFPFVLGDEGAATTEDNLEAVLFEWSGDRSVKVKIRDTVLTFST